MRRLHRDSASPATTVRLPCQQRTLLPGSTCLRLGVVIGQRLVANHQGFASVSIAGIAAIDKLRLTNQR